MVAKLKLSSEYFKNTKIKTKTFRTIYDIEAKDFNAVSQNKPSLGKILWRSTLIFFAITIAVFIIANYAFINSQITDWRTGNDQVQYIADTDGDGTPDWWEDTYGLNPRNPADSRSDSDNDSLSNGLEYVYGSNPQLADSDGDGMSDGEEIEKGYNPGGIGRIDSDRDGIPNWWEEQFGLNKEDRFDAELDFDADNLSNKDEFAYKTNPRKIDSDYDGRADGEEVENGTNPAGKGVLLVGVQKSVNDADGDSLETRYENLFGTDPEKSDTDRDGDSDYGEINKGQDPTGEGFVRATIKIPSISVDAPIIWSQSENRDDLRSDLTRGVIHYPKTAFPGMEGSVYITGHSSGYFWSDSSYGEVFKDLGEVNNGDEIIFHLEFKNKKEVDIVYQVLSSEVVRADDERLFVDSENAELTLVTCWPIGTDWKRLMIKGELK